MAETLLEASVNSAVAERPSIVGSLEALVVATAQKFLDAQLDRFPWYCYEARTLHAARQRAFEAAGNPGGWSEDRSFKFDYEIPRDLYLFMVNLVYKDFWAESNERVWRKFMKGICRGDDPADWLRALKVYYGSSRAMQAAGQL